MTLIHSSGLRKNRSAIPRFASSRPPGRPPGRLYLTPATMPEETNLACDLLPAPLRPQIWMSEATRERACAMQDAPGLPLNYRLALMSLTRLYAVPEQIGAETP